MANQQSTLTRRTALGALGIASAAAITPIAGASIAQAATRPDRSAWDAAMAKFLAAEKEHDATSSRLTAIEEAFYEAREKVPHVALRPDPYSGRLDPVTTADTFNVKYARRMVSQLAEGKRHHDLDVPGLDEHTQLMHELASAADDRDSKIKAIDEELGRSKMEAEYDAANDRMCDARSALIQMPAPDGEALLWKLRWLYFDDGTYDEAHIAQTVRDAHRIIAVGRA